MKTSHSIIINGILAKGFIGKNGEFFSYSFYKVLGEHRYIRLNDIPEKVHGFMITELKHSYDNSERKSQ